MSYNSRRSEKASDPCQWGQCDSCGLYHPPEEITGIHSTQGIAHINLCSVCYIVAQGFGNPENEYNHSLKKQA